MSIDVSSANGKAPAQPAEMSVYFNTVNKNLALSELTDPDFANSIAAELHRATGPVQISIANVLSWPDDLRIVAFGFLASLETPVRYFPKQTCTPRDRLFDAVLDLLADNSDMTVYDRMKTAALEVAVLFYPQSLEGCCDHIARRLRELGAKGVHTTALVSAARQILKTITAPSPEVQQASTPVATIFPDLGLSDQVMVPPGWILTESGIHHRLDGDEGLIPGPVLLTQRHVDADRSTELLTVAWMRDGKWNFHIAGRGTIANARTIVEELAPLGVPVTSNNAKSLVQFLADFEAANLQHLPSHKVAHRLGWQGQGGEDGFLWGDQLITSSHAPANGISFRGRDEGDDQLVQGFHAKGSLEEWLAALKPLAEFARAKLAFYTAFVPPLLEILKSPNFVLDLSGPTTIGKTTCLRVGASAWGNPDEKSENSVLNRWGSTACWNERAPAVLNGLPLFLDDTKHVQDPKEMARTIYAVTQGRGKGRGSVTGIARQDRWRTVLLSTGEQRALDFTNDGGTRPRVLSHWGSPFGATTTAIGELVRQLNADVSQNYGYAGPRFVQYLINHRDQWEALRKGYEKTVRRLVARAGNNPILARMADNFAAITWTAWLVHKAIPLPWEYKDPIAPVWREFANEATEADRAKAALQYVMDWANSNQHRFFERAGHDKTPPGGWVGRWEKSARVPGPNRDEQIEWQSIGFITLPLESLLHDGGFEPKAIIRMWGDEGWLLTTTEGNKTRRKIKERVDGENVWLVAIKREAVEAIQH